MPLLESTSKGLYCSKGDFYIDPWEPVDRAVITHAHSDHARAGSKSYLSTPACGRLLKIRLGHDIKLQTIPFEQPIQFNQVTLSLHPAGHVLGSAQVRVEHKGEIWVVSGDYKTDPELTCTPFEPVRCHTFITEATFGLPIFRWPNPKEVLTDIHQWWERNQERKRASVLFAYSLGKAQRVLASLDPNQGPILAHGAVRNLLPAYAESGISLPKVAAPEDASLKEIRSQAIVIAPPSAAGSAWLRRFGDSSLAFASGWMTVRGTRRRRAVDWGFILSDHADWSGLLETITATGAERVGVTHGYISVLCRWLKEKGVDAWPISTRYEGEVNDEILHAEEPNG